MAIAFSSVGRGVNVMLGSFCVGGVWGIRRMGRSECDPEWWLQSRRAGAHTQVWASIFSHDRRVERFYPFSCEPDGSFVRTGSLDLANDVLLLAYARTALVQQPRRPSHCLPLSSSSISDDDEAPEKCRK